MENVDKFLSTNIRSILNSVSDETVNDIIQAVKYAGLESLSDLQFVQEEDLILVLKPIPRRKLVKAWSKFGTHLNSEVDGTNFSANSQDDETNFLANSQDDETNFSIHSQVNKYNFSANSQVDDANFSPYSQANETNFSAYSQADETNFSPYSQADETNFSANSQVDETNFSDNSLVDETKFSVYSRIEETIFTSSAHINEMNKENGLYIHPHLRNGENRSESIMAPKLATTSFLPTLPVTHSPPTKVKCPEFKSRKFKSHAIKKKRKKWSYSKRLILLQVYTKYKKELSSPDINEVDVWKKIACEVKNMTSLDCDFTQCHKKINELRANYSTLKTKTNINQHTTILLNELRKAFVYSDNNDKKHE